MPRQATAGNTRHGRMRLALVCDASVSRVTPRTRATAVVRTDLREALLELSPTPGFVQEPRWTGAASTFAPLAPGRLLRFVRGSSAPPMPRGAETSPSVRERRSRPALRSSQTWRALSGRLACAARRGCNVSRSRRRISARPWRTPARSGARAACRSTLCVSVGAPRLRMRVAPMRTAVRPRRIPVRSRRRPLRGCRRG